MSPILFAFGISLLLVVVWILAVGKQQELNVAFLAATFFGALLAFGIAWCLLVPSGEPFGEAGNKAVLVPIGVDFGWFLILGAVVGGRPVGGAPGARWFAAAFFFLFAVLAVLAAVLLA